MKDLRDPKEHYALFEYLRKERACLLLKGERWLGPGDTIRDGDRYLATKDEWWEFMGPHCGGRDSKGRPIPLDTYCYTPKGKR